MVTDHRSSSAEVPTLDVLERVYRTMATITACETATVGEVRSGRLNAAVYPVKGLEAVCAALGECLTPRDYLVSTYRNLGDAIGKGVAPGEIVAEAYGRIGGTSKGKGGPMHLVDTRHGLMVTSGIVGGGVPIAVGLALVCKLDANGAVTAVTFGDGATSIGATHEALNLAASGGSRSCSCARTTSGVSTRRSMRTPPIPTLRNGRRRTG